MNNALSDTSLPPTVQLQAHKSSQIEMSFHSGTGYQSYKTM